MRYLLATVGVIFLLIVGIVIFSRSNRPQSAVTPDNTAINLNDYSENENASVQYTVAGPINANEDHRQIRITISASSRQIDVIKGYQGELLSRNTYSNNSEAYADFLEALRRANFTKERRIADNISPAAICPVGNRSFYQIIENSEDKMNLWTASCVGGTFGGNISLTNQLFQLQIPDYSKITSGVSIRGNSGNSTGLVL